MGLIRQLISKVTEKREHPSSHNMLANVFKIGATTSAGVPITPDNARRLSTTVYACVNVISQDCAKMPIEMFKLKDKGKSKEKATDHPLYNLLKNAPNEYQTAYEFKQLLFSWCALKGESFAFIDRSLAEPEVKGLYPMRPDRVSVDIGEYRAGDMVFPAPIYKYHFNNGTSREFAYWQILHFKINTDDSGLRGRSPVMDGAESIGLEVAARMFGSKLFSNGAQPAGILKYEEELTDEQYESLRKTWQDTYGGLSNAQKVAILEDGVTYEKIGMTADEAQFLETRKFQRREISAGIYRVPGPIIGDYEHSTFNNVEQLMSLYVQGCLTTWCQAFEAKCWQALLLPGEQKKYEFKFNMNVLSRGDMASRSAYYKSGRMDGYLCADDIREMEDMNPLPNGAGQEFLAPLNYIPAGTDRAEFMSKKLSGNKPGVDAKTLPDDEEKPAKEPEKDKKTDKKEEKSAPNEHISAAFEGLFQQVFDKYANRESKSIASAVKRFAAEGTKEELIKWGSKFYGDVQEDFKRDLKPVVAAYLRANGSTTDGESFCDSVIEGEVEEAARAFSVFVLSAENMQAPLTYFTQRFKSDGYLSSWMQELKQCLM